MMDTKVKFDLMHKVVRELDDLKNSQAAVIKKITQIEAHNMELGDSDLESLLEEIHENVANNLIHVEEAALGFLQKTEKYSTENSAALATVETV
jgi:hypothetical protein